MGFFIADVFPGCFIVRFPDGELEVMDEGEFKDKFEEVVG